MKLVDQTGKRFGRWFVESKTTSCRGMGRYLCKCDCGITAVVYSKHLLSGSSNGCRSCGVRRGYGHAQWTGVGEISGNWWNTHVERCVTLHARKPIQLTIDKQFAWDLFLKQDRKCALTGLALTIDQGAGGDASIDRIDSLQGYIPENVQWVHKDVNRMKNVFTQDRFIEICKLVSNKAAL